MIHVIYIPNLSEIRCVYLGNDYDRAFDLYCLYQRLGLLIYWVMKLDCQKFCTIRNSISSTRLSLNTANQGVNQ